MLRPSYIFVPLMLCCAVTLGFAQQGPPDKIGNNLDRAPSAKALNSKAVKSAARGDNNAAMHYYKLVLKYDSLNAEALEGFGEAAFIHTKYDSATWAFNLLLDNKLAGDSSWIKTRLADIVYCSGGYRKADTMYMAIAAMPGASARARESAAAGSKNCKWAMAFLDGREEVYAPLLPGSINSRYAEYAPQLADNNLYFTAYRFPLRGDSTRMLMQVLNAVPTGEDYVVQLADMNAENKHTAYTAFNRDKTVMYYAVGAYKKDNRIPFELYRRKKIPGTQSWGPAELLPKSINQPGSTNTQPNVGVLPGEERETLFFVSDRPGGKGKKDIWYCHIENDTFAAPRNLESLNTKEDDVSPFYHAGTGDFYFSSTGHPDQSLGGFDIYRAKPTGERWTNPEPLPRPFNSGANDVFFIISEVCSMQFFASNRGRGDAADYSEEACCYDLYATEKNLEIKIDVCHKETGAPLAKTTMQLFEKQGEALVELKMIAEVPGPSYAFPLVLNKTYAIVTSKSGFTSDTFQFNTNGFVWGKCLEEKRCLEPIRVDLDVYVFDEDTKAPLSGADLRFYDMMAIGPAGTVTTGQNGAALDSLITLNIDGNHVHYDLKIDHDYRLAASKKGFTSARDSVSTRGIARNTTLRRDVYLRRGLEYTARVFDEFTKEPLDSITFRIEETNLVNGASLSALEYKSGRGDNEYNGLIFYDRRYNVVAAREGYSEDSRGFRTDSNAIEIVPFQHLYDTLYLRRISLPIVLYYDNDVPKSGTLKTDTSTSFLYADTYFKYYDRKAQYLKECCEGLPETDPRYVAMDTFFDFQVQREWLRLRAFREYLTEKLREGACVQVNIAGFASPLGNRAYNEKLTHRRVDCLLNHLQKFEGETDIEKYYKEGRFTIKPDYNGSDKADKSVPKERSNKGSIYSVGAAKERKVMILSMEIIECAEPLSGIQSKTKK